MAADVVDGRQALPTRRNVVAFLPVVWQGSSRCIPESRVGAVPRSPLSLEMTKGRVQISARRIAQFTKLIDSFVSQPPTEDRLRRNRGEPLESSKQRLAREAVDHWSHFPQANAQDGRSTRGA